MPSWPGSVGRPVAIGAMRLSTDAARDDDRSIATLHAAFDAGATLVDTADAYALDNADVGHNERLIARALASWSGDRTRITVITKGGLTRPDGRWVPDGRARHLVAACQASRAALGASRIALYQLHAPDPRVAWTTSLRALAALARSGDVDAVGLCNVTVGQIEAARRVLEIAAVQVEIGPWQDRHLASGVIQYCLGHDIPLLGFRPFGGSKGKSRVAKDDVLARIGASHGVSPFEIVLAWLRGLSPLIVPLPGPTSPETARSCAHAAAIELTDEDRAELDAHFPLGRLRSRPHSRISHESRLVRPPGDIVMVMGLPGAGKSTLAAQMVEDGYERLNRDETGGTLAELIPMLLERLDAGAERVVLDNTYLSRASRAAVIEAAATRGRSVRALWLDTTLEDAQLNAVWRMVRAHGGLLSPDAMRTARHPEALGPSAQFRAQRELEPPLLAEGFSRIDIVPFVRRQDGALKNRAVIVWCDGILRRSKSGALRPRSADDVDVIASRRDVLSRHAAEGWTVLGLSWEPEIAERRATQASVEDGLARLRDGLGLDIEFFYCPHEAGPPVCWCRKPLPGLGVMMITRHRLDPAQCIYVGATPQDPPFARRLGFHYRRADEFFA